MKFLFLLILVCCVCMTGVARADHPAFDAKHKKVTLQLKWKHQFQFAGYYAALEQGYYRDVGLEVEIVARKPGPERPADTLLTGGATYAIEGANLLTRRLLGAPLVALAAIFQHSPTVAIALQKSHINTAKDMVGKRVMSFGDTDAELHAMLLQEGIEPNDITWQATSFQIASLINGETDLFSGYLTNEPFYLKQRQVPFTIINPISYGTDFYGDILFTSERELSEHPRRVRVFREASLKGWEYALAHPEEIVDLILNKYSQQKSREHLLFEAAETIKLIQPDLVAIGHINPGRFLHMATLLQQLGQVEKIDKLSGFIYDEKVAGQFSAKEISWLAQHNKVRVRIASLPPLVFSEEGQPLGIAADYLDRVSRDSGIEFEYLTAPTPWPEALQSLIDHTGVDLVAAIRFSPERLKQMGITDSYLEMPYVIFTREESDAITSISDLIGLKTVVPRGHLVHSILERDYPYLDLLVVDSIEDSLESLATGQADAYIGELIIGTHHIRQAGWGNLKVAAPVPFDSPDMAMGVRSDWPELRSIINRTLGNMSLEEHNAIRRKWLEIEMGQGVPLAKIAFWAIVSGAVFLFCFGLFWLWNRSLQKEVKQRKRTEGALACAVQQYQHLVQTIPHGIVEVDQGMQISYCNTSFPAMLGFESSELIGRSMVDLIVDDEPLLKLKSLLQGNIGIGEHQNIQLQLSCKQQQTRDVQLDYDFSGQAAGDVWVFIVTDLTRQEQARKALQKSEVLYRNTFENIHAGVAHLTSDGNIARANRFMGRMLGYSVAELLKLDLFQITYPEDLQISKDLLQHLPETDSESSPRAVRCLKKDGTSVWGLASVAPLPQLEKSASSVVVIQDIHEIKLQQREVAEKAQNLESIIATRTAELQQRVSEVEELNSAILNLAEDLRESHRERALKTDEVVATNKELEAFAYTISHDLRAPLRHISGFASVLQDRADDWFDGAARSQLKKIISSAEKMGKMIDDLLTFSRAGRDELMMAPVDMNLLFQEVRREIDEDYQSLSIDWQVGLLPKVKGDVTALRQVVINLLDNAAKYSAKEEKPHIAVDAEDISGEVVFTIRDNGAGFDPVYAEKLFNVFQRLHRDEEFTGTGIGLASVRRIILRHGGWIKGESVPGQGACFSFGLKAPQGDMQ